MSGHEALPKDKRALVAIDLGAESCRVSLLRWTEDVPKVHVVHRFANQPVQREDGLRWEMDRILCEIEKGLELCAHIAVEGVRSLGVDGWAVDYVRLTADGHALAEPFCYRDPRNVAAQDALHRVIPAERMRELTGVQLLPLNTVYQHFADAKELRSMLWLNLPEYVLYKLGARPVAEFTNATHTQMVGLDGRWAEEILSALEAPLESTPKIVKPGTEIGVLTGPLSSLAVFADTRLIAPCCHDTASAVAAVPDAGDDWAYISSGTWSLVGTVIDVPVNTEDARTANFTNLGGVDGRICFHKNVNGMWLLRQCMDEWERTGEKIEIGRLVQAASAFGPKGYVLDVDDPDLLLKGNMPGRINAQLKARGLPAFSVASEDAPELASFVFHSLAARYAEVLAQVREITGKSLRKIYVFGGGSQNEFLNELTAKTTGLPVIKAGTEGSTIGNFAVQLASMEGGSVGRWAASLQNAV